MNEKTRRWGGGAALVAGGLLAGGILTGTVAATAATSPATTSSTSSTSSSSAAAPQERGTVDESQPQRADEELLTGDVADKVEAAALARYPGATIQRVETDSDGTYEAHLTTADGQRVTVEVGEDFSVTGEEAGGPGRGGGPGMHGGQPGQPGSSGSSGSGENAPEGTQATTSSAQTSA